MDIKSFINDWLAASNAHDTNSYLEKYRADATLEDPSVGKIFKGHAGIRTYFEQYFIEYKTRTRLLKLDVVGSNNAFIEVEFTGEFPEGKINGTFEFVFRDDKIASVKADLI